MSPLFARSVLLLLDMPACPEVSADKRDESRLHLDAEQRRRVSNILRLPQVGVVLVPLSPQGKSGLFHLLLVPHCSCVILGGPQAWDADVAGQ